MYGAGAAAGLRRPRHPALDREVDLEGRRPVLVAAVGAGDPRRQPLAGDRGDGAGSEVEGDHVREVELGQGADPHSGLDPAAVLPQLRHERVGQRLRAAAGDRPADAVAGGDQRHPDRGAERPRQRAEGVGGDAAEQRPRPRGLEAARQQRGRRRGREAEAGEQQRVPGPVQDRLHQVLVERIEVARGGGEEAPPGGPVRAEAGGGLGQRTHHHRGVATVERVGEVDLGPAPREPVALEPERTEEGRGRRHRQARRAEVVDHSRHGQFGAAGAAADRLRRLQHRHLDPGPRQRHRAGQPVGARADDRRRAHAGPRLGALAPAPPAAPPRPGTRTTPPARAGARPCRRRRPIPPRPARSRRRRSRSAGCRCRPLRTQASPPAPRLGRTRSAPAPPPAAGGRGSGRRRSSSR